MWGESVVVEVGVLNHNHLLLLLITSDVASEVIMYLSLKQSNGKNRVLCVGSMPKLVLCINSICIYGIVLLFV